MDKNICLRTGEHAEDGQGQERLRLAWCRKIGSEEGFVKITICFPIYNKNSKNPSEPFWLWADTTFGKETAKEIIDYLESWSHEGCLLDTGPNLKDSISFTDSTIESEKVPCKKIKIFNPATNNTKHRTGLTKLNSEQSKAIVKFLKGFLAEETKENIYSKFPDIENLRKENRDLSNQVFLLATKLSEAHEKLKRNGRLARESNPLYIYPQKNRR